MNLDPPTVAGAVAQLAPNRMVAALAIGASPGVLDRFAERGLLHPRHILRRPVFNVRQTSHFPSVVGNERGPLNLPKLKG